jgi:hypothetical protein
MGRYRFNLEGSGPGQGLCPLRGSDAPEDVGSDEE